jgi:integrase
MSTSSDDSLPRHLYFCEKQNLYRYDCPYELHKLGVAHRKAFSKMRLAEAIHYAVEKNKAIDEYRSELVKIRSVSGDSKVGDLFKDYFASASFTRLASTTQNSYRSKVEYWIDKKMSGVVLRNTKINTITTVMCQHFYDKMVTGGIIASNNDSLSIYRLVFSYAVRRGYINVNPFTLVKPLSYKKRKFVWSRRDVKKFISTAFSKWKWRSIGIIAYCAYELGQRIGDMRLLTWDSINLETGVVTLTQSKRGAKVEIPTTPGLLEVLRQQHKTFGWQKYVAPMIKSSGGKKELQPYTIHYINRVARLVMNEASISSDLQIRDLRRTAITEMVEVGVPVPSIMAVSGHTSVSSLGPYIKHTLRSATTAQTMRNVSENLLNS